MGNCFWCQSKQLFVSSARRKYKKDCNILNIILVQSFSPLETEIALFCIGFCLNISLKSARSVDPLRYRMRILNRFSMFVFAGNASVASEKIFYKKPLILSKPIKRTMLRYVIPCLLRNILWKNIFTTKMVVGSSWLLQLSSHFF